MQVSKYLGCKDESYKQFNEASIHVHPHLFTQHPFSILTLPGVLGTRFGLLAELLPSFVC